jgi:hypothetical protein
VIKIYKLGKLGKLWWLFAITEVTATFLNPYIVFFSFFNVVELCIISTLFLITFTSERVIRKSGMNDILIVSIKSYGNITYVLSIIFFLIKSFVSVCIFIVGYKNNIIAAPYEIWSNPRGMSVMFFTLEMMFNVILLISLISKGRSIKRIVKEYE